MQEFVSNIFSSNNICFALSFGRFTCCCCCCVNVYYIYAQKNKTSQTSLRSWKLWASSLFLHLFLRSFYVCVDVCGFSSASLYLLLFVHSFYICTFHCICVCFCERVFSPSVNSSVLRLQKCVCVWVCFCACLFTLLTFVWKCVSVSVRSVYICASLWMCWWLCSFSHFSYFCGWELCFYVCKCVCVCVCVCVIER